MEEQTITTPFSEYRKLLRESYTLYALECAVLDNWRNYDCNCDLTGESECIFCTEDENN